MTDETERSDLARVEELFTFLQGELPEGYGIAPERVPQLTAEQARTVIWYLGEMHWQVPDYIECCDVCGCLHDTNCEGTCLDYGDPPYHFCDSCIYTEEYEAKRSRGEENAETEGKEVRR